MERGDCQQRFVTSHIVHRQYVRLDTTAHRQRALTEELVHVALRESTLVVTVAAVLVPLEASPRGILETLVREREEERGKWLGVKLN